MFKLWTKEEFEDAVAKSQSIIDTLIRLGDNTRSYKTFHKYKIFWNVDISHFCGKSLAGRNSLKLVKIKPLSEILVKDSTYHSGNSLKRRLFKEGLLKNECYECKITEWNNKPITLQLDHINGDHWDNRIENLRILCPNCHAQTDTFSCKGLGNRNPKYKKCKCGCNIHYSSSVCRKCRLGKKKIIWPTTEWLIYSLKNSNFCAVSRKLGVSDNAIRKHLKRLGIDIKSL